ncbi:MAG: hypothetical protein C0395_01300 [Gemmatimonas sp.]|nr:hypothetical protein [Gemmatimonas sp.]
MTIPHRSAAAATACFVLLSLAAAGATAEVRWRAVAPQGAREPVCLRIDGVEAAYDKLRAETPTSYRVRGPRRVKVLSRYVFAPGEAGPVSGTLRFAIDGQTALADAQSLKPRTGAASCAGAPASPLHHTYLTIPEGWHEVTVTPASAGAGFTAVRLFRETSRVAEEYVNLSPERYAGVATLQYDSGVRSILYRFDAERPLSFEVAGPTTAVVWTRLDFDHRMNGRQSYALEVRIDGQVSRIHHYDADKLDAASYIERPDVMPGERKSLRVQIPRGRHRVEIRCLQPEVCGVAAVVRIPAADLR